MMLCSLLSYLDRQALAVLSPTILAETKLTAATYSQVVSGFSIAYMIGNPLWGAILDRVGLRLGMSLAVALWSVASAAHSVLSGFLGFLACRAFLGFGEGATFPGGLRTAMDSLPPNKQSRGIAISYSGGSLGAILTPLLITPVAVRYGWRTAFLVTGLLGLVWLVLWRQTVRVPDQQHRTHALVLPNLRERRCWSLIVSYSMGGLPLAPILYLAPLYLSHLGFSQSQLGRVLWLPPLGWEVGYFFWGWFADRYGTPAWLFWSLALLSLPVVLITWISSTPLVLSLMFWSMFVAAGYVVVSLRTAARAYPPEQTALVAGIGAGAWSAVVAVVLPWLGKLFDAHQYAAAFYAVGLMPLAGTAIWSLLQLESPVRSQVVSSSSP